MNKTKIKNISKRIIAFITIPFILSGCTKVVDCDIEERHVHRYYGSNKRGAVTIYLDSEDETAKSYYQDGNWGYFTFYRQNDYVEITNEDALFYEAKGTMFYGPNNWKFLYNIMAGKRDYLEYQYLYDDGEGTSKAWSTDKNKSRLTGKVRVCHYKFCGHKLTYKDGEYINERSPFVDDIRDIIDEYPYFELDPYKVVKKEYQVDTNKVKNLKLEDIDEFRQPDLENKKLYPTKK